MPNETSIIEEVKKNSIKVETNQAEIPTPIKVTDSHEPKVSAFSLTSIRAKKALEESTKGIVKEIALLKLLEKLKCCCNGINTHKN